MSIKYNTATWNIIEKFASLEDNTMRVLGMKFPREGYT